MLLEKLRILDAVAAAAATVLFYLAVASVGALENGLARTPPMGWIAWERFTDTIDCAAYPDDCVDERLFRQMADRLAADGYSAAGYKYINIDDCWPDERRDPESGELRANATRFPAGLGPLADYIHAKDLRFGIYGDCGTATCAGYPAQLKSAADLEDNYFQLDANQMARWRVDSFKFDGCNLAPGRAEAICPRMASALKRTERPVLLICEWPFYMLREHLKPNWTLAAEACNVWRYFEDVEDSWLSVLQIIDFSIGMQGEIARYHGPGHWFDPDQLVVGNFALSLDEARAQMAIWSIWSAPLYMGNDLRSIAPEMAAVLKNAALIGVDQDALGIFGLMVSQKHNNTVQAFVKPVLPAAHDCPSFVVVFFNRQTLGNSRDVTFETRALLRQAPINLAAKRQQLYAPPIETSGSTIRPVECKELIWRAMTRRRAPTPPPGLVLARADGATKTANELPLEERRVTFKVTDLFGDPGAPANLALGHKLTLRVNPSGVRAVKLTISDVDMYQ